MTNSVNLIELKKFLIRAKVATYAMQGDEASMTPLLPGSKQLEHRHGPYFYRDIYFGMNRFIGLETVYVHERAIWSMSYAGGVLAQATEQQVRDVYAFLRQALREPPPEYPFRGPPRFAAGELSYMNECVGGVEWFHGRETIVVGTELLYELRYAGGLLA